MLTWKLFSAVVASGLLAAAPAWAEDETATTLVVVDPAHASPIEDGVAPAAQSEYWLGLYASPPSPALQAQLNLHKDQGLLVENLLPEGPAAKAGVKQYDILLVGNGKPLRGLNDLLQLINEAKEGKLQLELLRAGDRKSLAVTPAKRPKNALGELHVTAPPQIAGGNWIGNLESGAPMHFRVIRPGQILPGGPTAKAPGEPTASLNLMMHIKTTLADGSNIEVVRKGPEPAQVTVTHDKEKWEGTSSDLSKIPETIRPEVERLLHLTSDHNAVYEATIDTASNAGGPIIVEHGPAGGFGSIAAIPAPAAASPEVAKRLGEMQQQIEELKRTIEAFKAKQKEAAPKSE